MANHWTRQDIQRLNKECNEMIINDHPPPRLIEQGKVNLKYFIYQIQNLKGSSNKLKRKLNNRELQLNEFRKRLDKLKNQSKLQYETMDVLKRENINVKVKLSTMKRQNEIYEKEKNNFIKEIKELKKIIAEFRETEIMSESEIEEDARKGEAIDFELISASMTPNTQDNAFLVDDDDDEQSSGSTFKADKYESSCETSSDDSSSTSSCFE